MIAASMNGTCETKRRGVDKIALLGLFIVAVLAAHFIVVWRSSIVLSEPIELDCAGLSVSIPSGNGWRSEKQWKYEQNGFTLSSFFDSGSGEVTALVSCRYLLSATQATLDVLFKEKVSEAGGVIAKTGQIEAGKPGFSFAKGSQNGTLLTVDWAHIKRPETLFDMFFGVAQLPNNRRLDIEVSQATGDIDLTEGIFKSVTESLKFTDNQLLEAGSKIISEIKSKGLDSFLAPAGNEQGQGREGFFLIKEAGGRTIGFAMEVLGSHFSEMPQNGSAIEPAPEAQLNILAGSFYYIRRRYDREQATFFQSDNNLDEFVWKSESSSLIGRSGTEMVLSKDGIMTVKKFDMPRRFASQNRSGGEEKDYQIGPAAIPDVLGELVFSQMLDSDRKEIFVDIIEADGRITPALVSRTEAEDSVVTGEEAGYVFRVEFLDGRGFSEQVYLDGQRRISKILLQQENTYTLERTSAENILREFPEQGSYILQKKDKILEQKQLQENSG